MNCPDCGAESGQPHVNGCDVARCRACGYQRIGCEHEDSDVGWGSIWRGEWPGRLACEYYEVDLNHLNHFGGFRWNQQAEEWVR